MHGHQTVKTFSIEAQINKQTLNLFGIPTEGQLTDKTFSCSQNKRKESKAVEFLYREGSFYLNLPITLVM
jgi:fructose-1,6-bisphosphatase